MFALGRCVDSFFKCNNDILQTAVRNEDLWRDIFYFRTSLSVGLPTINQAAHCRFHGVRMETAKHESLNLDFVWSFVALVLVRIVDCCLTCF